MIEKNIDWGKALKIRMLYRELYFLYSVIIYMGKNLKKEYIYIYITESLSCTPETNTTL